MSVQVYVCLRVYMHGIVCLLSCGMCVCACVPDVYLGLVSLVTHVGVSIWVYSALFMSS